MTSHLGRLIEILLPLDIFTDNEGDLLTYKTTQADLTALPAWLSFDASRLRLYGTPNGQSNVKVNFFIFLFYYL